MDTEVTRYSKRGAHPVAMILMLISEKMHPLWVLPPRVPAGRGVICFVAAFLRAEL